MKSQQNDASDRSSTGTGHSSRRVTVPGRRSWILLMVAVPVVYAIGQFGYSVLMHNRGEELTDRSRSITIGMSRAEVVTVLGCSPDLENHQKLIRTQTGVYSADRMLYLVPRQLVGSGKPQLYQVCVWDRGPQHLTVLMDPQKQTVCHKFLWRDPPESKLHERIFAGIRRLF